MLACDPYKDTKKFQLIRLPEGRGIGNEYKYDRLYRLCAECQGKLSYFEVAPEDSEVFCFSMWVLKNYEKGGWDNDFRVTRSDLWSTDAKLSSSLMKVTFIPLSFHQLIDLDIVYIRCMEKSCIVSYNSQTKSLDVCCNLVGTGEDLSWRVVIPFVLPIWPTPIPVAARKAVQRF